MFIFQTSFFHIKCAPVFPKIGEDPILMIKRKKKELKLIKFIFIIHFGTFGSNLFLALKVVNFEDVF